MLPRPLLLVSALAVRLAAALNAQIAVQPIHPSNPPIVLLAEISYQLSIATSATDPTAEIAAYEPPGEFPEGTELVRVGAWDAAAGVFASATTATSAAAFEKGYAPVLSVTAHPASGAVISVALRGVAIDPGYTRDFGPRVEVRVPLQGKQPELNKPVVLSPDGKKIAAEEKTFLQKYWWLIGLAMIVSMLGGGGGDGK